MRLDGSTGTGRAGAETPTKEREMIVSTGPSIEGRQIRDYLGIVSSQAIMGVNIGKDLTAGFRNIVGGRSKSYEGEIAKAVSEVMEELKVGATNLGADAVVSIDIDYETVGSNMLMVAASGTAVKLG
jgi:uncharacterized protein YbjQ (UPF0145 family)